MTVRSIGLVVLAVAALETAALACECVPPPENASPALLRKETASSLGNAVALVEIEATTSHTAGTGEIVRVERVLGGTAPSEFRISRSANTDSSGSCDSTYKVGDRDVVILYPAITADASSMPTMRISGACLSFWLEKAAFRNEIAKRLDGPTRGPERG